MHLAWRALKIVLIDLLLCIVLLIPLELYFGTWLSGEGAIALFDARPNLFEMLADPANPSGPAVTYRRDRYGLRSAPQNPAEIDALAIGGSTTIEQFLNEDDTWTMRLQHLLRQNGCPIAIANAGIDGYSTAGHIASFDGWFDQVPGLKPRFILVYVGINDALIDPVGSGPLSVNRPLSRWEKFQTYIAAHSALNRAFVTLRGSLRAHRAKIVHGQIPVPQTPQWRAATLPAEFGRTVAAKVDAYRQRLAELNRLIHQFGARPIYITQRRIDGCKRDGEWQEWPGSNGGSDSATLEAIDAATLSFCADTKEICVDLAHQIDFAPGDLYDAVHTLPPGSARIAQLLAPALQPLFCGKP